VAEEYVKDFFVLISLARTLHSMYGSHLPTFAVLNVHATLASFSGP